MTHRSHSLVLLPLLIGALCFSPTLPVQAKKPTPKHALVSPKKKKLATAYLVLLWTDQNGEYDKDKASKLTLQDFQKALAKGADINGKDKRGMTALIVMAGADNLNAVHYLLAKKAKTNVKSNTGLTALMEASSAGDTALIELLLAHGAEVNAKGKENQTALLEACSLGNADALKMLIAHGADVNATDDHDNTALSVASMQGKTEIVKILQAAGAK